MQVEVDAGRLAVVLETVLQGQAPELEAELRALLAEHEVVVHTGEDGAAEWWHVSLAGHLLARVHRSRIEAAPHA